MEGRCLLVTCNLYPAVNPEGCVVPATCWKAHFQLGLATLVSSPSHEHGKLSHLYSPSCTSKWMLWGINHYQA